MISGFVVFEVQGFSGQIWRRCLCFLVMLLGSRNFEAAVESPDEATLNPRS